jgi:hypothetical protein
MLKTGDSQSLSPLGLAPSPANYCPGLLGSAVWEEPKLTLLWVSRGLSGPWRKVFCWRGSRRLGEWPLGPQVPGVLVGVLHPSHRSLSALQQLRETWVNQKLADPGGWSQRREPILS